jgi:hypothetical protein
MNIQIDTNWKKSWRQIFWGSFCCIGQWPGTRGFSSSALVTWGMNDKTPKAIAPRRETGCSTAIIGPRAIAFRDEAPRSGAEAMYECICAMASLRCSRVLRCNSFQCLLMCFVLLLFENFMSFFVFSISAWHTIPWNAAAASTRIVAAAAADEDNHNEIRCRNQVHAYVDTFQ